MGPHFILPLVSPYNYPIGREKCLKKKNNDLRMERAKDT